MLLEQPRIMLVDDSRLARAATAKILERSGCQNLVPLRSAAEAFEHLGFSDAQGCLANSDVDLIILDVDMPCMDGITACQTINGTDCLRDIPIIMLTVVNSPDFLAKAFPAGAMDCFVKPVQEIELLARVNSALKLKAETDKRKVRESELLEIAAKLSALTEELSELSSRDGLTGAPNRRYFDEYLGREWRRVKRHGTPIALIMT